MLSPRKVGLTRTHTCLELSESFINRPTLGREHLCLPIASLGWVPKLPVSRTITCYFHAPLYIYFTEPMCLLSPQIHLENMLVSCRTGQRSKTCGEFSILTFHSDSGLQRRKREPLMPRPSFLLPQFLLHLPPLLSSLPVVPFFLKDNYKHALGARVPFCSLVRHSRPPAPAVPMWGRLSISSGDNFLKGRFEPS